PRLLLRILVPGKPGLDDLRRLRQLFVIDRRLAVLGSGRGNPGRAVQAGDVLGEGHPTCRYYRIGCLFFPPLDLPVVETERRPQLPPHALALALQLVALGVVVELVVVDVGELAVAQRLPDRGPARVAEGPVDEALPASTPSPLSRRAETIRSRTS